MLGLLECVGGSGRIGDGDETYGPSHLLPYPSVPHPIHLLSKPQDSRHSSKPRAWDERSGALGALKEKGIGETHQNRNERGDTRPSLPTHRTVVLNDLGWRVLAFGRSGRIGAGSETYNTAMIHRRKPGMSGALAFSNRKGSQGEGRMGM